MTTRETISTLASTCAIAAFIAGTAASTINAGLLYLGSISAGIVLFSIWDAIRDKQMEKEPVLEALKGLSTRALWIGLGLFGGVAVAMLLDYYLRGSTWNQHFGLCQFAGVMMAAAATVIIVGEWRWDLNRRYKKCPDCAQKVLADARKCRYCSYRFVGE